MTDQERIKQLEQEVQQLKYALVAVFEECSDSSPEYLSNRIKINKSNYIKNGLDINSVVSGES